MASSGSVLYTPRLPVRSLMNLTAAWQTLDFVRSEISLQLLTEAYLYLLQHSPWSGCVVPVSNTPTPHDIAIYSPCSSVEHREL